MYAGHWRTLHRPVYFSVLAAGTTPFALEDRLLWVATDGDRAAIGVLVAQAVIRQDDNRCPFAGTDSFRTVLRDDRL